GYGAVSDQVKHRAELAGRYRRRGNGLAFLVEPAEQLGDYPIRSRLAVAAFGNRFEELRRLTFGDKDTGVVVGQRKVTHETRLLLVGQFGKLSRQRIDIRLVEHKRPKIGVRKLGIVVRLCLGSHGAGFAARGIEQPGLLLYRAALLNDLDLPARFVLDRLADKPDRIHIFYLASGAERFTGPTHRHIHVGAQTSLFHVAVAGAEIAQDRAQLRYKGFRFVG